MEPPSLAGASSGSDPPGHVRVGRPLVREPLNGRKRWRPLVSEDDCAAPPAPVHHLAHAFGSACPHMLARQSLLDDVQKMLAAGKVYVPPEHERSPSPEPTYDALGQRTNPRDVRARDKLVQKRQRLIAELVRCSPPSNPYKPPADYKAEKLYKRVFVPIREYPGFNFIGLILGPRGNTQKRLERESGCKIAVRGKGSLKEGMKSAAALRSSATGQADPSEHEDLHVLITGDDAKSVRIAAELVEKLLDPGETGFSEFKTAQLRELAVINGTVRDENQNDVGNQLTVTEMTREDAAAAAGAYQLPDHIKERVEAQYARDVARNNPETAERMDEEFNTFMEELGGSTLPAGPPPGGYPPPPKR